jgi:hypothetical protein
MMPLPQMLRRKKLRDLPGDPPAAGAFHGCGIAGRVDSTLSLPVSRARPFFRPRLRKPDSSDQQLSPSVERRAIIAISDLRCNDKVMSI